MSAPVPALPPARTPRSPMAVIRGLAAVAVFLLGAADALLTAWLGTPRLGWLAGRLASLCGEQYRRSAWGAADAQVIDADPGHDDVPGAAGTAAPGNPGDDEGKGSQP